MQVEKEVEKDTLLVSPHSKTIHRVYAKKYEGRKVSQEKMVAHLLSCGWRLLDEVIAEKERNLAYLKSFQISEEK